MKASANWTTLLASVFLSTSPLLATLGHAAPADPPDFNRDIRPILSEHCFQCHGPDANSREADLRLDVAENATADRGGYQVIVPGDPDASELYRRVVSDDEFELMPPPDAKRTLTEGQIQLLKDWIATGAPFDRHWAFVKPARPQVPDAQVEVESPIDAFISQRLADEGLSMSPPADPHALIRRVSLDLIGLPPDPDDVERFVGEYESDPAGAYEALVDRTLASERFGERWAQPWLDLARYADSNGFQADQLRDSWAYRDWVIDAMNANMPFDQFTIEQLAGDLLPDATIEQKIATGFHRTVTCNVEAGVHEEENRTNQVVDRVNTTATVWLGLTLACVQCHDHKFDPFTMEDYYSLFAYFNNTPLEVERPTGKTDVSHDFIGPYLELPLPPEKAERRKRLQAALTELRGARKQIPKDAKDKLKASTDREAELNKQLAAVAPTKTLVMVEMNQPRETHVQLRGNYLTPGKVVSPRTPKSLHPLAPDSPPNRLGLARWLVSPENPLTARVTVNRWWAELFGRGIVATLEDFGTQADPPTHPELLDWLAVEFMESGWDRKHMLKLMVMSATYRQQSRVTPDLLAKDPENKLYARAPRFRLDAERIRDHHLAVSGLLSTKMHGPPVMPYQPPGIWRQVGRNEPKWVEAKNEDRWRRGVYIVYRRAAPYPSMVNFDAPDRGACTVKRPRTNTPLQALTLQNDTAYVEAALALADRILCECSETKSKARLEYAYRIVLTRLPKEAESLYLTDIVEQRLQHFTENPDNAKTLIAEASSVYKPKHKDQAELAAWFYVASVLLNLDESITKG